MFEAIKLVKTSHCLNDTFRNKALMNDSLNHWLTRFIQKHHCVNQRLTVLLWLFSFSLIE